MTLPAPRTAAEYWERSRCPACGQIVFGAEPPEAAQGSGSLDVLRDALVRIGSDPSVPIPVRRQAKEAVRAALAAKEAGSQP